MKRTLQALAVVCLLALSACAQGGNAYGSLSAATADCITNPCVVLQLPINSSGVALDLDGTFVATLQFESQAAPGATWRAISVTPIASTTTVSSATAVGSWRVAVSGLNAIRVRPSAWVSGTVKVNITASPAAASLNGGGGGTPGGNNTDIQYNNAGSFGGVAGDAGAANNFITGISSAGITKAQPTYANISGTPTITGGSNILQKGNGSGGTSNSSLTDDGSVISSAEPIRLGNGTTGAPSYAFTNATTTGFTLTTAGTFSSGLAPMIVVGGGVAFGWTSGFASALRSGGFAISSTFDFTANDDTFLTSPSAAQWQLGAADAATSVAQTFKAQDIVAGTAGNVAGQNTTFQAGNGVGSGGGGSMIFQTAIAHGSDTVKDTQTTALTLTNKTEVQAGGYLESDTNAVYLTADWTCGTAGTVSSCVAATIIGSGGGVPLTFTLPLVARSWTWECTGVVGQATAATANSWNFLTATNGATNVTAWYDMYTAATAKAGGATTDQASTTTTVVIGAAWTLGGTATKMPFKVGGRIEGSSASGTVLSLQLVAPTVADVVTIYRGAGCRVW